MNKNKILLISASLVILLITSTGYLLYNNKETLIHKQPQKILNTDKNTEISDDIKSLIGKYYKNYNSNNYTKFCEKYIVEAEPDENQDDVIAGCEEGLEQLNGILGKEVSYNIDKATISTSNNIAYDEYTIKLPVNYKKVDNVSVTMVIRKYPDNTVKMYEAKVNLFNY